MSRSPFVRILGLLLSLGLVAAACGSDGSNADDTPEGTDGETAAVSDAETVSDGKLTVCSEFEYAPFEFTDEDGTQTGYDIELMREIATIAGLELEVRDTPFDGILGSLAASQCDAVASAMTITDERAENADFSEAYYTADQSLLVRAEDVATYTDLASLAGETIAVQGGTTGEGYAEENATDSTIESFAGPGELFAALTSGQVAAVLQDSPVNQLRADTSEDFEVTEVFETGESYGFAVAKDNAAVLGLVNDGLTELRDNGKFDEIFATFFG